MRLLRQLIRYDKRKAEVNRSNTYSAVRWGRPGFDVIVVEGQFTIRKATTVTAQTPNAKSNVMAMPKRVQIDSNVGQFACAA